MNRSVAMASLVLLFSSAGAAAEPSRPDVKRSKDHPLIPRYEDSYIAGYAVAEFDAFMLPLGKFAQGQETLKLEGKLTKILYYFPNERSTLEVMRNYEKAIERAGFKTLFRCGAGECSAVLNYRDPVLGNVHQKTSRVLSAKLSRPGGDVYALVHVDTMRADVHVIEIARMEEKMVTVAGLADDISRQGHTSIYAIHFGTDKADLEPASNAALKEIGEFLKANPKMEILVVGHTDNVGAFEHNLELSKLRAEAVAKALSDRHGVASSRLTPYGAGPIAPVATNRTDEGKALNRRVDLVER